MRFSLMSRGTYAYTCAFCEFRQASRQYHRARNSKARLLSFPACQELEFLRQQHFTIKRCFSLNRTLADTAQTSLKTAEIEETPEYSFTVGRKESNPHRSSQIRQSLREWSARNKRISRESAPDFLPYEGKITQIPNSLFIDAEEPYNDNEATEADDIQLDEHHDNASLYHAGHALRPGTLMSHRSLLTRRQDVIYLGQVGIQSLLVLSDGRWMAEKISHKRVGISTYRHALVPDFLSKEEIETLRAHLPKQVVTRSLGEDSAQVPIDIQGTLPDDVTANIVQRMRVFQDAERRFLRDHKQQLEQMYEKLSYDHRWRILPVKQVPLLILGMDYDSMSSAAAKAFVQYANTFHPLFVGVQTAETVTYYIGPKSLNEDIKSVQKWARQYQEAAAQAALGKNVTEMLRDNPLSSFIDKARRLIVKSRKIRTPTSMGVLGPAFKPTADRTKMRVPTGETFSADDRKIISYLWDTGLRRPISRFSLAHASLIVRAVGAYPNLELNAATIRMLLQELGCVEPWASTEDISLPIPGTRASWELDQIRDEALSSIEPIIDHERTCTKLPDSMVGMRKHWGDLKAICIDNVNTNNIEDAMSVETARELDGGFWIHAHFAHPTAHIDVHHPVAQLARKCGSASYSNEENASPLSMVPISVIRQFSLQPNSPALTVSTLLTKDGSVHDIKVAAGVLKSVEKLDRKVVDKLMGNATMETGQSILVVGTVSRIPELSQNVSNCRQNSEEDERHVRQHLPELKLIQELLTARRQKRLEEVETASHLPTTGLRLATTVKPPTGHSFDTEFESRHWNCDPGIVVLGRQSIETTETADEARKDDVVAQLMRLASESLGNWFADRGIPAVFLGNDTPEGLSIADLNQVEAGDTKEKLLFTRSSFPRPLHRHNLKQYAGCTSPLRKYIDMIAHFQVDSYLKAQARGIIPTDGIVEDQSVLAFTKADIDDYLAQDIAAADAFDGLDRERKSFWATQALFRAFHFKEANLPEVMEVMITNPTYRNALGVIEPAKGTLIPWCLNAKFEPSPDGHETTAKYHEFIRVKLISVDPKEHTVTVRAIGLATTGQQLVDPVQCLPPVDLETP